MLLTDERKLRLRRLRKYDECFSEAIDGSNFDQLMWLLLSEEFIENCEKYIPENLIFKPQHSIKGHAGAIGNTGKK